MNYIKHLAGFFIQIAHEATLNPTHISLYLSTLLEIKPHQQQKKWLKSNEVRELLNISPGTLQNLRINGTLTYTRVGGILFYESAHIDKLLNENKTINR